MRARQQIQRSKLIKKLHEIFQPEHKSDYPQKADQLLNWSIIVDKSSELSVKEQINTFLSVLFFFVFFLQEKDLIFDHA